MLLIRFTSSLIPFVLSERRFEGGRLRSCGDCSTLCKDGCIILPATVWGFVSKMPLDNDDVVEEELVDGRELLI